jgi:hypothetical protein
MPMLVLSSVMLPWWSCCIIYDSVASLFLILVACRPLFILPPVLHSHLGASEITYLLL